MIGCILRRSAFILSLLMMTFYVLALKSLCEDGKKVTLILTL